MPLTGSVIHFPDRLAGSPTAWRRAAAQVYSVMRVDALAALVPFATLGDVEQIIVDAIKHNYLSVRRPPRSFNYRAWGLQIGPSLLVSPLVTLRRVTPGCLHLV